MTTDSDKYYFFIIIQFINSSNIPGDTDASITMPFAFEGMIFQFSVIRIIKE